VSARAEFWEDAIAAIEEIKRELAGLAIAGAAPTPGRVFALGAAWGSLLLTEARIEAAASFDQQRRAAAEAE
jgi:hypothetical protein